MSITNGVRNAQSDVIVCGAGPVGLAAALALADIGATVTICGELPVDDPTNPDLRTAALFAPQIAVLKALGIWSAIAPACAPLQGIRLVDDTGHILRAPETVFMAGDAGLPELGHNCPNPAIVGALVEALSSRSNVECRFGMRIASITHPTDRETGPSVVRIVGPGTGDRHELHGTLIVGAEGSNSMSRTAAGIATHAWNNRQAALTAHIRHSDPHHGISTEFHRQGGPLTVVPLPDDRSALIWVDRPGAIGRLTAQTPTRVRQEIENGLHGLLGDILELSPLRVFPLSSRIARHLARRRTVLVGEAAHAFPPIGAQGLNLSLRDVAVLAETVREARAQGQDIGSDAVLDGYARRRLIDTGLRAQGVDLLGMSLTSVFPGPTLARGMAMHAANAIPPLRRAMMSFAMGSRARPRRHDPDRSLLA